MSLAADVAELRRYIDQTSLYSPPSLPQAIAALCRIEERQVNLSEAARDLVHSCSLMGDRGVEISAPRLRSLLTDPTYAAQPTATRHDDPDRRPDA